MSLSKTMLAAALLATALSGCGTLQTKTPFPTPPEELMKEPPSLASQRLKSNPLLSDVETQHAKEALLMYQTREQVLGLQDWIRRMQAADAKKKAD